MNDKINTYAIDKVLMPVDFSPASERALQTAIAICKRQYASLILLHVVETNFSEGPAMHGFSYGSVLPELVDIAKENLEKQAKKIRLTHDLVVTHLVQAGHVADQINQVAMSQEVDLIVVGAHRMPRWREFLQGSTAFRLIKSGCCPVLSVREGASEFKNILFPVRMVAHVVEKYDVIRPIIRENRSRLHLAAVQPADDEQNVYLDWVMSSLKHRLQRDGVSYVDDVYPADQMGKHVVDLARQENTDLIVINGTLDSMWRELFPGTFVQEVLHHAKPSVLAIPDP